MNHITGRMRLMLGKMVLERMPIHLRRVMFLLSDHCFLSLIYSALITYTQYDGQTKTFTFSGM